MIVVIAIIAILISIAVPNMSDSSKRNAVKAAQRNFLGALHFARNEALSRGKFISICPSVDGLVCEQATFNWSRGFLVFIDDGDGTGTANDGVLNGSEETLLVHQTERTTNVTIKNVTGTAQESITWNYQGFVADDSRALVVICDRDNLVKYARGLMLERTGRVMSSQDNGSGLHESKFISADGSGAVTADLACG